MIDQAANLRKIVEQKPFEVEQKGVATIFMASGQLEVERACFTASFAIALAKQGERVLLIDMDEQPSFMADLLEVGRYESLFSFLKGEKRLEEVTRKSVNRLRYAAGGRAFLELADAQAELMKRGADKLGNYCDEFDYVLFISSDCHSREALRVMSACDVCYVGTTVGQEDIVETFKLFKKGNIRDGRLIFIVGGDIEPAKETGENFVTIIEKYIGYAPQVAGYLGEDDKVDTANRLCRPYVLEYPECVTSLAVRGMAAELKKIPRPSKIGEFFSRLRQSGEQPK